MDGIYEAWKPVAVAKGSSMATVLIVEDEDFLRDTLARFLAREGHDVLSAADGAEAFRRGVSGGPEVLVTDWMLRDHLHGLHVSEALRAVDPSLRTILITGFPSQDLRAESNRLGVSRVLTKPFDLEVLCTALQEVLAEPALAPEPGESIAVLEVSPTGVLEFANARALELFDRTAAGRGARRLDEVLSAQLPELLQLAERDWVAAQPLHSHDMSWLLRARPLEGDGGWLVAIFPKEEEARTFDPRVRILLDHRSRSNPILPDQGPVVVIERDGAVRRLLVSQIERIGGLCYATDDLEAALTLIGAEARVAAVLLDFTLAGSRTADWLRRIDEARPGIDIIGTGGIGSEDDLLALGVKRVLHKPWRIMDLMEALRP